MKVMPNVEYRHIAEGVKVGVISTCEEFDVAIVILRCRYPEMQYVWNTECTMEVWVLEGTGSLYYICDEIKPAIEEDQTRVYPHNKELELNPRTYITIEPGDPYCWVPKAGYLNLLIKSSPPFYPEQQKKGMIQVWNEWQKNISTRT